MPVSRMERNANFTVMSNLHLRDRRLSLKAKGLLSQMLSLPEDWRYTLVGLAAINREQTDAVREAVRELERAGYVRRARVRDARGRFRGTEYVICERPPASASPAPEKPPRDIPTREIPTQLKKEPRKKKTQNTDLSNTDSLPVPRDTPEGNEGKADVQTARNRILENIGYDELIRKPGVDPGELEEVVDLMVETAVSRRKTLRIAGDEYPAEFVRARFQKLTREHIEFVFDCLRENTSDIRNYRKYLLAALFNAPSTMLGYYRARVNHDFACPMEASPGYGGFSGRA